MKTIQNIILLLLISTTMMAQEKTDVVEKRIYNTNSIANNQSPNIDGILNDEAWNEVEWGGEFKQRIPEDGVVPSQKTEFKIMYDDRYLYVAVNCLDTEPDKIVKQLSRRDGYEGDFVIVSIDSYHDLSTCFSFTTTAAGVKGDEVLTNNGQNSDVNWNPIWYTASKINADGWTAEMKIPLSQLRFSADENQVWGLQVDRMIYREGERAGWQRVPREAAGWISNFGEIHGLKNLKPKRQVEVQPYVVGKLEKTEGEEGNPFQTGTDTKVTAGLDGKIGITNDVTLDFTINPDFGQVEADPANVTLDGYQIFVNEQRPFFVENSNIFDYGFSRSEAGNTFWSDNLFYSRRIGKNPSHYPDLNDGDYSNRPNNTTILGAAKVSGKTRKGWNIGIMESVTAKEYETISHEGETRQELIEPLTNYFVGRLQKEFNERNTTVGGILTSTNRKLEGDLDWMHKSAMTGGLDFKHNWKDRKWYIAGNVIASKINGSTDALMNTQQSITHLLGREDADHISVDTTATSMVGNGGMFKIGKVGGSPFMFESGFTWRSPKLNLNDIGFLRTADDIRNFTWMGYALRDPFSIFNRMQFNANQWVVYDFGGNPKEVAFNINMNTNFKNNWSMGLGTGINSLRYSNSMLRGGPRFRDVPTINPSFWFNSNYTKPVRFGGNAYLEMGKDNATRYLYSGLYVRVRPMNTMDISIEANYSGGRRELQYVDQIDVNDKTKYIVSQMDRQTLGVALRVNYTINPNLSIQYYGQPYSTKANFSDFKEVTNAGSKIYNEKFDSYSGQQVSYNAAEDMYRFDKTGDGSQTFEMGNPDFSYVQFRSNLVLRWEYLPGSELFFVWSQGATGNGNPQDNLFRALDEEILGSKLENIFLVKATYRLVL